jgi:peptidyl-prolyl cis-trans isomerase C
MKITRLIPLAVLVFSVQHVYAQSGAVVSVNGTKIMQKDVDTVVRNAQARGAKDSPELRQAVTSDLVIREAIMQDVKKTGLEKKGDNPEKLKFAHQQILQDLWFDDYFKQHPISDAEVRADYDRQANLTKDGRNSNEYKFSQIVVSSEAEANDMIKQINGGASFEKIAKEKSLEPTSAAQGGAIPNWVLPDMVVPSLGDSLVSLSKGKLDPKPIKTNLGWHVVRVDDVRKFKMPSFDEAKGSIYQGLVAKKKQEAVEALMKRTTIAKP